MASPPFRFKRFEITQEAAVHPVGTDSVLLGAWVEVDGAERVLDIGTGTGVVALMLAQRTEQRPEVRLVGVELHLATLMEALANKERSPWSERIELVGGKVQDYAKEGEEQFDLIVSNPPFFTNGLLSPDWERSLGRSAASLSPNDLIAAVKKMLTPAGRFCVILPTQEGNEFCGLCAIQGLYNTRLTEVQSRTEKPVERLLLELQRDPYQFRKDRLLLFEHENSHSAAYREMTADFYLNG